MFDKKNFVFGKNSFVIMRVISYFSYFVVKASVSHVPQQFLGLCLIEYFFQVSFLDVFLAYLFQIYTICQDMLNGIGLLAWYAKQGCLSPKEVGMGDV